MTGPFLRLPLFEGPLDLLLHLAQRNAVAPVDLPMAEVTTQFLAYLDVMEVLEIEVCGEFIEVAALLCLIKSRELLPSEPEAVEDDVEDPRAELMGRLLEYAAFREAAVALGERPRLGRDFFVRPPTVAAPTDLAGRPVDLDLLDLLGAVRDLLERRQAVDPVHAAPHEVEPIEVRMEAILRAFDGAAARSLDDLLDAPDRAGVVSGFLAILELLRGGMLRLRPVPGGPLLERGPTPRTAPA